MKNQIKKLEIDLELKQQLLKIIQTDSEEDSSYNTDCNN